MNKFGDWLAARSPELLSILRIMTALLFMEHGGMKLLGFPAPMPNGTVPVLSFFGFAGLLELAGGLLVAVGLFTRPAAFILSGEMAVAYFLAHGTHGFWPVLNHGELAILYCFVFLYVAAAGGGAWSVDRIMAQRPKAEEEQPSQ